MDKGWYEAKGVHSQVLKVFMLGNGWWTASIDCATIPEEYRTRDAVFKRLKDTGVLGECEQIKKKPQRPNAISARTKNNEKAKEHTNFDLIEEWGREAMVKKGLGSDVTGLERDLRRLDKLKT